MNFTQINYFLTVAKTLSFTKAASLLYITQPAISRQIIMMENELGFKLFTRANRTLRLTPEGFVMAAELDKVCMSYDSAVMKARTAGSKLAGRLRVGIADGLRIDDMLSKTLRKMAEESPEVDIALFNFSMEETAQRLLDDRLDIAFLKKYGVDNREFLEFKQIAEAEEMLAVSEDHPLAGRDYVTVEDLRDTTVVMVSDSEEDFARKQITELCRQRGFEPKLKYSPSYHANLLWVKSNSGAMLVDCFDDLPEKGLVLIPFEKIKDPSLVLTWYRRNFNPTRLKFEDAFFAANS